MKLSIIVTSYKNPGLLRLCLDSIKNNLTLSDFEIIVADSETEEDTEILMRESYPEIKFLPSQKNVGFQFLVRRGFETSQGDYIFILNGDIIATERSIEKLLEYLENNPSVGLVGPKLLNFNETLQYSCFRFYKPTTIIYRRTFLGKFGFAQKTLDYFLMKDFDRQNTREVDWIMGSAIMTSRKAIKKVGLMDPRFKMYLEDTDWCRRFWKNSYSVVYFPNSQMYHYHGRGSAGKNAIQLLLSNPLTWLHISSALKYFIKYLGQPSPHKEKL